MTSEKAKEDIDVKVVSKEEALWQAVVNNLEAGIDRSRDELSVNEAFLELAKSKLAESQE